MRKLAKARLLSKIAIVNLRNGYRGCGEQKIFCVGRNKNRSQKLLVLNVAEKHAYQEFVAFLSVDSTRTSFPWKNRT